MMMNINKNIYKYYGKSKQSINMKEVYKQKYRLKHA
jgi:hypothetical protein